MTGVPESTSLAPHNIEAEQALLGAMLAGGIKAVNEAQRLLRPDHFFEELHGRIFSVAVDLAAKGRIATAISVKDFLPADQDIGGMTIAEYLVRLVRGATTLNVADYGRVIVDLSARRRIISECESAIELAHNSPVDTTPTDQIGSVVSGLNAIAEGLADRASMSARGTLGEIAASVVVSAEAAQKDPTQRTPSTGLRALDEQMPLRGLAAGGLTVLAGRPGMGKTLTASVLARNVARSGGGAIYFSLEVTSAEISARVVSSFMGGAHPSYADFMTGHVSPAQLTHFQDTAASLREWPLYIDDTPQLGIGEIAANAEAMARQWAKRGIPLRLVVIDHAKIVRPPKEARGNAVEALGMVANGAKVLAKRLRCNVVLCCQLNRSVEGRDDKRPSMADLRASGEIEEAADAVVLLYRPAYYLQKSPKYIAGDPAALSEYDRQKNTLELIVDKSRQGKTGIVTVWCDPAHSSVNDIASNGRYA